MLAFFFSQPALLIGIAGQNNKIIPVFSIPCDKKIFAGPVSWYLCLKMQNIHFNR